MIRFGTIHKRHHKPIMLGVAVLAVMALAAPAAAAPDPAGGGGAADAKKAPELVVPGTGKKVPAFSSLHPTDPAALPGSKNTKGSALDPAAVAAGRSSPRPVKAPTARHGTDRRSLDAAAGTQSFYCDEFLDQNVRVETGDFGEQVLFADYYGDVLCNFYLIEGAGVAGVIDRTPGFDGQVLSVGDQYDFVEDYYGFSTGGFALDGDSYAGARSIEVVEEVYLYSDIIWGACNPLPGLRYLACDGLGSNLLHVIVGTGPFDSGLDDPEPLILGDPGQEQGCRVTVSHTLTPSRGGDGEHFAQVGFEGTIGCSNGITGTSRARLVDVDANGNPGIDLKAGGESGANGRSAETASFREKEDHGRRVQVVYSGRSEAPPGRTWRCFGTGADDYLFTRCATNGNVVTWEAIGPLNGGRADQLYFDTGIPPFRDCHPSIEVFHAVPTLAATGVASCNQAIPMTVTVDLTGTYDDGTGQMKTVTLPSSGSVKADDGDGDGRAAAEYDEACEPFGHQVTYEIKVTTRFEHPEGWHQLVFLPDSLDPPMTVAESCAPPQ